jgi:transposase InsO family protein
MIDEAIDQLTPLVGTTAALAVVGADRATWYRHHRQSPAPVRPERIATPQPRALTPVERKEIKRTLESDEFVDEAPATVYAKLLDRGTYLASISTMYRVLHEYDEVRERRRQATHPAHKKPELIATKANSVWSWDITKLHGPEKWTYYYLYVILDLCRPRDYADPCAA